MAGAQQGESPHQFTFVAAPPDLAPYLNSLYSWQLEEPRLTEILPAYSGQMVAFVQGSARMKFDGDAIGRTSDAFFAAPLLQARQFEVTGPARAFGVSLNFRGWAALTGLDVTKWHDRFFAPGAALGEGLAEKFAALAPAWRSGALDDAQMLDAMVQIVREGLSALRPKHIEVIDHTLEWLSSSFKPDLADLYASLPYSERQVQRLVAQFFGQSPIRLIRRYRAIRAATLLSFPQLAPEVETEIRDAFYDQAHLIKEIRYFTGRTPRLLIPDDGSAVTDMLGPDGYGSVDLFGGNQDEQLGDDG
ncbi:helix-turn-helix transcriptional regulator [Qipengyuania marisflavi]|uniref:Helix-turn-helix domain-containing protein n=1 Tax=Qipengyuania marisflavi TaxID=2486356 RepID=A0A5S3P7N3_9SPHN|nr:helix-turn-helix domain-containing protein [Qipengyuania marisflavi]TMM48243.1 helix-turn-helix domain-containing protein [Qipengyuania marisflavi]